ncbi:MAG TPA: glycerol-3-phosphate ABC transporter ATP-binding protein [Cyanobacteria bacterium UBA11149]|nr:glycerol-3-phosphate ABC transporter ATP-binding protein [Cyanobacteria bacterium UBA11367]HBE61122.1 glycerol-3-phosphate ABC transporter ATP-binding protein [Cyanobacteria bacterium UBA11366]HBK62002.1 glycerol-3-phosphate ABC transporter ATP-binding protein [Cyanobacteria bacterium UBA11166]HBR74576.1 glycerol-3-phosphate ABC transporter ATP-binding protein [Cyanobacteria bacterium UBA11159]HBS71578.1 glycerol-3-phosphate ABC transporter ATP-binding protein [Cyanobacteria bacterium UBA111
MAKVVFECVSKKFDNFVAVNNLNLTVDDGEFLVFVGPSGCGKTTSLRLLAGLEEVTQGNIYIGDRRVNDIPSKDRDIAMVFQSYALYPHMSVYENMAFSLELQKKRKSEIKTRVAAAAKQLEIEHLLHRKPKELSGGQRQRVAVGRAIVRNPAVFLMDEPLSNLDAQLRVQARAEISKLHNELGTTFIYVTHDQVEAMTMGTRIAVMNGGILQQVDTPENLYNYPQNIFVASFMGCPAMNLFKAFLVNKDETIYVKTESFEFSVRPELWQLYEPYQGKEVILGIRPESIHDPDYIPPGIEPALVPGTVSVIEMMGNETIIYLNTVTKQEFVARIDPRSRLVIGESVTMVFDKSRFHLFDKDTEQIIGSEHLMAQTR